MLNRGDIPPLKGFLRGRQAGIREIFGELPKWRVLFFCVVLLLVCRIAEKNNGSYLWQYTASSRDLGFGVDERKVKEAMRDIRECHKSISGNAIDMQKLKTKIESAKKTLEGSVGVRPLGSRKGRRRQDREVRRRRSSKNGHGDSNDDIQSDSDNENHAKPVEQVKRSAKPRNVIPSEVQDAITQSQLQKGKGEAGRVARDGRHIDRTQPKPRKDVFLNNRQLKPCDRDRCDRTLRRFFSGQHHYLIGEQALKRIRLGLGGNRGRVMDLMRVLALYGDSAQHFERAFKRHIESKLPDTSPAKKRIYDIKMYVKQEFLWWRDKLYITCKNQDGNQDRHSKTKPDEQGKYAASKAPPRKERIRSAEEQPDFLRNRKADDLSKRDKRPATKYRNEPKRKVTSHARAPMPGGKKRAVAKTRKSRHKPRNRYRR